MSPGVAVVVPLHNRADRVARLVAALEAQTLIPSEVVFVDDASSDGTDAVVLAEARRTSLPLRVIRLSPNRGPAGARNAGWRATVADVVAFTDDDCVPEPDWLRAGASLMNAEPGVGIVQGATVPERSAPLEPWYATRHIDEPSPWFEGCNLFVRRDALEQSGGFSEDLRMGFEDTWLGWAVIDAGWGRGFAETAVVKHDVSDVGFRWHVREAWRAGNVVPVAARFPGFRATLWRPWAFRPSHAAIAAALIGAAVARRPVSVASIVAGLGGAHLWTARTSRPNADWVRARVGTAVLEVVAFVSVTRNAARHRTLLV